MNESWLTPERKQKLLYSALTVTAIVVGTLVTLLVNQAL
ncbi:hypothetical protein B0I26_10510 [Anoxybacillus vitaminiphilus]|uniref:Uncharacterized protein n=1 Tax=Paranoxybacillus vitaminiphilus TaxID=581036 RepID=A0A327YNP5_9BACL|nr:hypothetical protein B0I26_10510 [Anoxybacillus vitaminiphilus]